MRVFVAFHLPEAVTDRLTEAVAPLRERFPELNWTPPASWHVTLAFLGEVDDDRRDDVVAAVGAAVDATGTGAIELELAGPGRFGARVGWLAVVDRPSGAVAELGEAVQAEVVARDLPVDRKEVRPHVTLVRARGRRGRLPHGLVDDLPRVPGSWTVEHATVYRSRLGAGPVEYEPLAEVSLTGR